MTQFAVILAAGRSARFGSPKQLAQWGGETFVARAVRVARTAGFEPVVVTGYAANEVAAAADARCIFNARWADGIGVSIAAAAAELGPGATGLLILACDQVEVGDEDLRALRSALGSADVAAAAYGDVIGIPALFAPAVFGALAQLTGDVGARELLRGGAWKVARVALPSAARDIDEPDDLEEGS